MSEKFRAAKISAEVIKIAPLFAVSTNIPILLKAAGKSPDTLYLTKKFMTLLCLMLFAAPLHHNIPLHYAVLFLRPKHTARSKFILSFAIAKIVVILRKFSFSPQR